MLIEHDVDLRRFNTFGISAVARRFTTLQTVDDVIALAGRVEPFVVIGGGSNIVLSRDPPALVARMAIMGRSRLPDAPGVRRLRVAAGEAWDNVVSWSLEQDCPGLENLSAIPGTCGGGPIQNIGAYGVELSQRIESVEAIEVATRQPVTLRLVDCGFGYRDSIFKREQGRFVVTGMVLAMPDPWRPAVDYGDLAAQFRDRPVDARAIREAVVRIRAAKLPDWTQVGNVGSFFKNPVVSTGQLTQLLARHPELVHYPQADGSAKVAAGWLIDRAGWRGRQLGRVAVHDRQALVLINRGGADGKELLALADRIRDDVATQFSIRLEREPVVI